jgi:hypothetical protein
MKSLKSSWKVGLAVGVGLVLGAWLFRAKPTQAQYGSISVHVTEVATWAVAGAQAPGTQIVGFSCVQTQDGNTDCYIASR